VAMTQFAVDTVLPANHPEANGFVVAAPGRAYFFPDTAVVTTSGQYTIVRGYDGLFVFPKFTTYVRRMSSSTATPTSSIPVETNSSLVNAFATQSPRSSYGGTDDPCPDCSFAVLQSIDAVPGLDTETATSFSPATPLGADNTTCGSAAACGVTADNTTTTDTAYTQNLSSTNSAASSNGSCLLSNYQYDTDSNTCVPASPGATTFTASTRRGTSVYKVGFAADYTWSLFHWVTTLTTRSGALLYKNVLWDAVYQDIWGGYASGEGVIFIGYDGQIQLRVLRSGTWMSWSEMWFWDAGKSNVPFIGFSGAALARWTW
jgi:hypothetical protein